MRRDPNVRASVPCVRAHARPGSEDPAAADGREPLGRAGGDRQPGRIGFAQPALEQPDLARRRRVPVLVEDAPVLLEGAHGDAAHRRRGGDGEARFHVLDDAERAAADRLGDVAGQDRGHGQGLALVARERGGLLPDERSACRLRGGGGRWRRGCGRSPRRPGRAVRRWRGFGLWRDPEEPVEVLSPARVHGLGARAVLLQDVEGEHVVPPEILHEGVDEWIRLRLLHGRPV